MAVGLVDTHTDSYALWPMYAQTRLVVLSSADVFTDSYYKSYGCKQMYSQPPPSQTPQQFRFPQLPLT